MNYVNSIKLFGVEAKEIPCIKNSGAPTTATEGAVGCLYMDIDNGNMYKCTAAIDGVYTWVEVAVATESTAEKYFDIDYDGIVSLKAEYRGHPDKDTYPYAVSDMGVGMDGSKIDELPEKIVIPNVIGDTAVAGFQPGMFYYNCRIKEIVLPDAVSELPDYFCNRAENLQSLSNTEQVTKLGSTVMAYTRLEKVTFPNLKEVEEQAFAACGYLYSVDIGDNLTELPKNLFAQCVSLSQVKGGASVTSIGETAFQLTRNLKNLPLLSHVTSIGKNAFYRSRIQFDWSTLEGVCTFAERATPVIDNTTDYWTGATYTPCENPLGTLMSQRDPRWRYDTFGDSGRQYTEGCAVFAALHVHSALSGNAYSHPDEFAEELRAIDPTLVSAAKHPSQHANMQSLIQALGYTTTMYDSINITAEIYQAVCDALARGAYVLAGVSTPTDADSGHMVVLYGINSIGEVLVVDSENTATTVLNGCVDQGKLRYRMPYQNLTGPASTIIIVEENA